MKSHQIISKGYLIFILVFVFHLNPLNLIGSHNKQCVNAQTVSSPEQDLDLFFRPDTAPTTPVPSTYKGVCICVPPGSCSNDGAGLINVRILSENGATYSESSVVRAANVGTTPITKLNTNKVKKLKTTKTPEGKSIDNTVISNNKIEIEDNQILSATTTSLSSGFISPINNGNCLYGLTKCCRPGHYRCGERYPPPPNSPKTEEGQAPYGSYPWMAAILSKPGERYLGGGALIDYRHIITAAHKVFNISANTIKIRLGEWNAKSGTEPIPPHDYIVSKIFTHANYTKSNLFNDIAIIRLATPVHLGVTPTISTVCLTGAGNYSSNCYVAGWGKNNYNGTYSNIQKHVRVTVKVPTVCQNELRNTILGQSFNFNSKSFVCAGGELGRDACTGDGGSPLVCNVNGRWAVVGLVAWGIGCGRNNVPGVYVNVPAYLDWIEKVVNLK